MKDIIHKLTAAVFFVLFLGSNAYSETADRTPEIKPGLVYFKYNFQTKTEPGKFKIMIKDKSKNVLPITYNFDQSSYTALRGPGKSMTNYFGSWWLMSDPSFTFQLEVYVRYRKSEKAAYYSSARSFYTFNINIRDGKLEGKKEYKWNWGDSSQPQVKIEIVERIESEQGSRVRNYHVIVTAIAP